MENAISALSPCSEVAIGDGLGRQIDWAIMFGRQRRCMQDTESSWKWLVCSRIYVYMESTPPAPFIATRTEIKCEMLDRCHRIARN